MAVLIWVLIGLAFIVALIVIARRQDREDRDRAERQVRDRAEQQFREQQVKDIAAAELYAACSAAAATASMFPAHREGEGPPKDVLSRMLDNARADGMREALEIAKREAMAHCGGIDAHIDWEDVERAIAERQAALRSRSTTGQINVARTD